MPIRLKSDHKTDSEATLLSHFLPIGDGGRAPRGSRLIPPRGVQWLTTRLQVTEWPVGYPLALSGKNRTEVHSVGRTSRLYEVWDHVGMRALENAVFSEAPGSV